MGDIREYEKLTYIECYDGEIRSTVADLEIIQKILDNNQFLLLENELINKSNIKRVFTKELSDVDKIIYSIEDKTLRNKIQADIDKRYKDGLRVNSEIVCNLLSKYNEND